MVVTFSDVQANLAADLIRRGFPVLATNQRTLAETEATLALLSRVANRDSESLLNEFRERLAPVTSPSRRPRVYFEEWNDPLISGIGWVNELLERAGGQDIFADLSSRRTARERAVLPEQVSVANPEIIFASWCGKPFAPAEISARPGWSDLAAVRHGQIHEIPGEDILQPGFRLVYGYERIKKIIGQQ